MFPTHHNLPLSAGLPGNGDSVSLHPVTAPFAPSHLITCVQGGMLAPWRYAPTTKPSPATSCPVADASAQKTPRQPRNFPDSTGAPTSHHPRMLCLHPIILPVRPPHRGCPRPTQGLLSPSSLSQAAGWGLCTSASSPSQPDVWVSQRPLLTVPSVLTLPTCLQPHPQPQALSLTFLRHERD